MINISNNKPISFRANLKSPKLRYSQKDFFIKIRGYGRNTRWANEIIKVADAAVYSMREKTNGEAVLKQITLGVSAANRIPLDLEKRIRSGILRSEREGWDSVEDDRNLQTCYTSSRYKCYSSRLDKVAKEPLNFPYKNMAKSVPGIYCNIYHTNAIYVNNSLNLVFELYKKIFPKFSQNGIQKNDLENLNNTVAEIRWILAHATPWLRGSDAISNVFMRAIYKAVGVKTYPPAKGVSFDLEAYCTNLDEYKRKFPTYFEKPPTVIE